METINKITDKQIEEMAKNLAPINTWLWEWDYDIGESYIQNHEEEISIYDNSDSSTGNASAFEYECYEVKNDTP